MIEGEVVSVDDVKKDEPVQKKVEDIIKRYMESQTELMEMITTLFIRLQKLKEI